MSIDVAYDLRKESAGRLAVTCCCLASARAKDFHPPFGKARGKGELKVKIVLTAEGTVLEHIIEGTIDLG
jgi:hypothetical protein